jgi:hypothetical protein
MSDRFIVNPFVFGEDFSVQRSFPPAPSSIRTIWWTESQTDGIGLDIFGPCRNTLFQFDSIVGEEGA